MWEDPYLLLWYTGAPNQQNYKPVALYCWCSTYGISLNSTKKKRKNSINKKKCGTTWMFFFYCRIHLLHSTGIHFRLAHGIWVASMQNIRLKLHLSIKKSVYSGMPLWERTMAVAIQFNIIQKSNPRLNKILHMFGPWFLLYHLEHFRLKFSHKYSINV